MQMIIIIIHGERPGNIDNDGGMAVYKLLVLDLYRMKHIKITAYI